MRYCLFILLLLIAGTGCLAQDTISWYDPIPVAGKTFGNLHPRIALNQDNNPIVLWADANGNAYLARWAGNEFAEPLMINTHGNHVFAESWAGPEMTGRGDTIYVAYKEVPEEDHHIFIKHSYDGGKNFSIPEQVDSGAGITRFPTIAMDPFGNPLVVFMKLDKGYNDPRFTVARSKDLGESFTGETEIRDFSGGAVSDCCPAKVIESGNATVLLYRQDLGGTRNVWAGISGNAGKSFKRGIQLDQTNWKRKLCPANPPDGVIISDTIYSVFMSGAGDSSLVYFSKASLTGLSASVVPLTGKFGGLISQNFPRIESYGEAAAILWEQAVGGTTQICLMFTNELAKGLPESVDTVAEGSFANADVAIGGGHIYVVYEDDSSGSVMCRIGRYKETVINKLLAENVTMGLKQSPSGKYFSVNISNISSCIMSDLEGKEYEMDMKCNHNGCKVFTEDLDPGLYIVHIFTKDDQVFTYKYEVKEEKEKEEKERR